MNKEYYSDQMIIKFILSGGPAREKALKYLFNHKPFKDLTKEVVTKAGGSVENVKTVFQQCLIQLDREIRRFVYKHVSLLNYFEDQAKISWCQELQQNEIVRNQLLSQLSNDLDLKRQVRLVVIKNSGKTEDAEDCFQNGLLLLNSQLIEGKYRGGAIKGFFYQTCYNLWRNELKKQRTVPLSEERSNQHIDMKDPLTIYQSKYSKDLLDKVFDKLGSSCQKILNLKYFILDQLSMDEIAARMGLKNAQNASNTLSKCRRKLWELLNEHEHPYIWTKIT